MLRWGREGEKRESAEHGDDPLRFADVRRQVIGGYARHGQRLQRQVEKRGVCVLSVGCEGGDVGVRWRMQVFLALGDKAVEPGFAETAFAVCTGEELGLRGGEEDGDGFVGWC